MSAFANTWAPLLYLAAGILFILALRGLSSPATARKGNRNGMIGMTIAVITTLVLLWESLDVTTWAILLGGAVVGGAIGAILLNTPGEPHSAATVLGRSTGATSLTRAVLAST